MKNSIVVLFFALLTVTAFGQKDRTLFSKGGVRITGGWGGSAHQVTALSGEYALFNGGFGGVELNKNWLIGGGGLTLANNPNIEQLDNELYENMRYSGLVVGYGINSFQVVHPQIMLMGGTGFVQTLSGNQDNILVLQPSAGLEINVLRWMRVGVNAGYRFVSDGDFQGTSNADLSNAYGEIRLRFGWSWGRGRN